MGSAAEREFTGDQDITDPEMGAPMGASRAATGVNDMDAEPASEPAMESTPDMGAPRREISISLGEAVTPAASDTSETGGERLRSPIVSNTML